MELLNNLLPKRMCVTEQHAHILMPTNQRDLRDRQPLLEQAANRLMPQIMEAEIMYPGPALQSLPIQP
jgi:hypothetical protein